MINLILILLLSSTGWSLDAPQVSVQAQCDGYFTYVQLEWPNVPGAYTYSVYWAPNYVAQMTLFQSNVSSPFQAAIPTGWDWQYQPNVYGFFSVRASGRIPIAYYQFNGNAENSISDTHDGVVHGASFSSDRHGDENASIRFDGIDDYVWMPDPITESPISISYWFKLDQDADYRNMTMLRHRSHGYHMLFTTQNGQMKMWSAIYVGNGSQRYDYISPTDQVADFNWHHCVVSYDENVYKVYVDDQLVLATSVFGENNPICYGTYGTAFGRDGDQESNYFDGWLDDIKYFDYAVSIDEVHELFHD